MRFQDRALLRCTPTLTKAFLLRQWQHLVLSTITLLLTIPTHGTQTDPAEANSQLGRPPVAGKRKEQLRHARFSYEHLD